MFHRFLQVSMSRKEGCFMNEQFEYRSVFAPYFDSFLKMKDTMGYGLNKFGCWIGTIMRYKNPVKPRQAPYITIG